MPDVGLKLPQVRHCGFLGVPSAVNPLLAVRFNEFDLVSPSIGDDPVSGDGDTYNVAWPIAVRTRAVRPVSQPTPGVVDHCCHNLATLAQKMPYCPRGTPHTEAGVPHR
jgi:hypothetical protein